jgi:hypothetical protein
MMAKYWKVAKPTKPCHGGKNAVNIGLSDLVLYQIQSQFFIEESC